MLTQYPHISHVDLTPIIVLVILAVAGIYLARSTSRSATATSAHRSLSREQKSKLIWRTVIPYVVVITPIIEELIFRLPLMIFFDGLTTNAWIAIAVSSVLFGVAHTSNGRRFAVKLSRTGEFQSIRKESSLSERRKLLREINIAATSLTVIHATIFGAALGAIAIATNQIWITVLLHILWNTMVVFAKPWKWAQPLMISTILALLVASVLA